MALLPTQASMPMPPGVPMPPAGGAPMMPMPPAPMPGASMPMPPAAMLAPQMQTLADQQTQQQEMMMQQFRDQVTKLLTMLPTPNPAGQQAVTEPLPASAGEYGESEDMEEAGEYGMD